MKIIETKTVILEDVNFEDFVYETKQNRKEYFKLMDKVHAALLPHGKGFWSILKTDKKDVWEFKLDALSEEIENAGYNWKEYQQFRLEFYKGRLWGSTPVGFKYKG
jgi:hypothetical protein